MNHKHLNAPKSRLLALLAASLISLPLAAHSEEREDLEKLRATVLILIETLVKSGVIPRNQADAMMREAQRKADVQLAAVPPPEVGADGKKIVRVPYVPEAVRTQMRDQITAEVLAQTKAAGAAGASLTESGAKLQIEGDLRLRAEAIRPGSDNSPASVYYTSNGGLTRAADAATIPTTTTFNTQQHEERSRVRARLGFNVAVADTVSAGLSLATGNVTGPTSTNQTMAAGASNTAGYFNKYSVVVDKAYVRYEPLQGLSLSGGRIRNPFLATDLIWADDLNFEGFAAAWKAAPGTMLDSFATMGWFPLSYAVPGATSRRSLMALQGGINWQLGTKENRIKLAAALYDYSGIEGIKETTNDKTSVSNYVVRSEYGSGYRQRGNTLFRVNTDVAGVDPATNWGLASSFRELDLTAVIDVAQFDPLHVILTGDIVRNLAFDRGAMQRRSGNAIQDGNALGYMLRAQVGAPVVRNKGEWNVSLGYRHLGSDAVLDAFTNSDFGRGGTNNKGFTLGGNVSIAKNTWLSGRWMSSDLIDSMVPAASSGSVKTKFGVDTLQVEINARY